ncbi:nucleolar protein 12-like isoform X2 [Ananas comosus]|uniref:Nucleolar protein 12-like isoform X2 n=1 Tax=Ananas comosus TaxID=4615 RepID=A0A6P5EI14_ANACO|nr:nucleolar protein 12-like isoform X2 [Ananas comosus]
MEETVLSWDSTPRSFGMDRRSPVADKLRAAVADELFHFLGDYSDDVLAEYIVVLVCNGKNQNQARDDLEAFLGDDSAKFVAWLWNYLNKETKVSDPPFDSSNHQTGVTSGRSDILSKDGLHEPAENPNLTCANTNEVNAGGSLNQTFETHNGVQRYTTSSSKIYSPEILNRCDRRLRYESQHHKIAQNNSIVVASGRSPLVNSELVARSTQSVHKEDFQLRHLNAVNATARRLPLKAMDVEEAEVPQPTTKRRGNVWDRLGKRSVEDDLLSRENTYLYGDNEEKHKKPWLASVEPYGKLNEDEMLDVKSKLRQVQINMLKLRSKQAEMSNAIIKAQPGPQNNQEEDTESRTVLVTNVHFAASKEALMSHFMKCGAIIKVIMLTDTITGQPKGAAYIVFKSKDSVDKAVSMNGTSFFSRILMVMHKADTPPGFLVPAQQATKPLQPWSSQPFQKPPYQKHSATSHLQWRRES